MNHFLNRYLKRCNELGLNPLDATNNYHTNVVDEVCKSPEELKRWQEEWMEEENPNDYAEPTENHFMPEDYRDGFYVYYRLTEMGKTINL